MKNRVVLTCILLCIICFLVWFRYRTPEGNTFHSGKAIPSLTNSSPVLEKHQKPNVFRSALTSPTSSVQSDPRTMNPEEFQQWMISEWQRPINFYGKVVDENSNAIAGANVVFNWDQLPLGHDPKRSETESDSNGFFSLTDAKGSGLDVWVSKRGYYTPRAGGRISNTSDQSNASNLVIFKLRKKRSGVELITSEKGMRPDLAIRVSKDGVPVRVNFLQKQPSKDGQLEISQIKPPWKEAIEWSFQMSIPHGGFVENQDEFQFQAPESNYQPTVQYDFKKSQTNWITHVSKQFYIEFGEPRKYGWLRIESDLSQETVFLTYAINPDGSRDLEPK